MWTFNNMQSAINSKSYEYLKGLISPQVRIVDIEVWGKWLRATLSSGVYFSVLNNYTFK